MTKYVKTGSVIWKTPSINNSGQYRYGKLGIIKFDSAQIGNNHTLSRFKVIVIDFF